MEKVLKKYTTIPQHLYVDRNADTQLKRIIEEMQRPGYVLVARQMGKTNLLFNAKRTLENLNRVFAYVDLSNLYRDERDCYRNIINNIIEPNLNFFKEIEDDIDKIRAKNLPPHNEYSRSLVTILNFFKGDLVIILDEIDALKSIDYSDNIFAQIRSNYFSRTNYPVLERLTYVLSGVIEPTELIKDKNKSPFNIGDKIYLDDFTKDEHDEFITKSKLTISPIISDTIFKWTNGNPRLTFDICAEVENYIIDKGEIDIETLDKIITKKYLTSFDIAPIDHIRELVKTNKDIRRAISNIHKKNSTQLNDEIKRKLYLYGIINSNFNEETHIKNKIIGLSLSEEWIRSIDKEKEISFVYGLAKYGEKDFQNAIEIFKDVILTSDDKRDIEASNYFAGLSYLKLNEFENAISYFSIDYIIDEDYKNDALAFLGVCQMAIGDGENAINTLKSAVKNETNSYAYHNALLNLAVNINDEGEALVLFQKLYDSTLISKNTNKEESNQLKTLSLYYQSDILERRKEKKAAVEKIILALEYSNISDSLFLIFNKYHLQDEKNENLKKEIVHRIVDSKLTFDKIHSYPISFTETHIYYYLDFVFDKNDLTLFNKLLDYVDFELLPNTNRYEIIYKISNSSINNKSDLLEYLLKLSGAIEDELLIIIYRDILILNSQNPSLFLESFNQYLDSFEKADSVINNDIYVFALCIKYNSDRNNILQALNLCKIIDTKIKVIDDENLKLESVIIYYWFANLYFSISDRYNAVKYANIALELIKDSNGQKLSMIDETGLKSISNQLYQIKASSSITNPITSQKKYQRNDRVKVKYIDGSVIEKKYKYVEADILSERCMVL
jgi:hypothetical protein